jgi:hypothetical protein
MPTVADNFAMRATVFSDCEKEPHKRLHEVTEKRRCRGQRRTPPSFWELSVHEVQSSLTMTPYELTLDMAGRRTVTTVSKDS